MEPVADVSVYGLPTVKRRLCKDGNTRCSGGTDFDSGADYPKHDPR